MSKCKRCNRGLKAHHESGMGEICRMKSNNGQENSNKIRVEPLFIRFQPRRSYLVFTSPRQTVVVNDRADGRFATCGCSENIKCEHIALVAEIDNHRFPQKPEPTKSAKEPLMIAMSARRTEFIKALERAENSKLEVFANFEQDSFTVVNSENKQEYKVIFLTRNGETFTLCNCSDFCNRERICKHISEVVWFAFGGLIERLKRLSNPSFTADIETNTSDFSEVYRYDYKLI